MDIIISGKHLNIGESLKKHVEVEMKNRIARYFQEAVHSHVTISKHGHFFHTDVTVNEGTGTGILIRGEAEDTDAYHSVDVAVAKVEKQLRRYKDKLHDIHKRHREGSNAMKRIFSPLLDQNDDDYVEGNNPAIISEHPMKVERLSVSDAVRSMDMLSLPSMLFININTGDVNMVYYRKDGNIAWVETNLKP